MALTQEQIAALDAFYGVAPAKPDVTQMETAARGIGQGASLGFADEVMGAIGGLYAAIARPELFENQSSKEIYQQGLDIARKNEKAAQEANPNTYLGGQIAGSLLTPMGALAKAKTAPQLAATGAVLGGASGLGQSEGATTQEVLKDTALGAGLGAVLNPVLTKGAQTATNAVRNVFAPNAQKLATFREASIAPTLADISDSNVVKRAQNIMANTPLASGIITKGVNQTAEEAVSALNRSGLNQATTQIDAGEIVKTGLNRYVDKGKQVSGRLFDKVDSYIAPTDMVDALPILSKFDEIIADAPTEGLQSRLKNSAAGQLMQSITDDIAANGGKLPYDAIKKYRTLIGRQTSDLLVKGEDKAVFDRLYGGLSETMKQAAADKGPEALKAFNAANKFYSDFTSKVENYIQPLLKKDDVQELFQRVLSNQKVGNKTASVMATLKPDERQIVRGSILNELGRVEGGEFDPFKAAGKYLNLNSDAQNALKLGLGKEAAKFDAAMSALQLARETAKQSNPSGSGYTVLAGGAGAGLVTSPIATLSTLAGANISARLFTNQNFINWLANAPSGMATDAGKYIAKLGAFAQGNPDIQNFIESLAAPTTSAPLGTNALTPEKINALDAYFQNQPIQGSQSQSELGGTSNNDRLMAGEEYLMKDGKWMVDAPTPSVMRSRPPQPVNLIPMQPQNHPLERAIINASQRHSVNPQLMKKIGMAESSLGRNLVNPKSNAIGVFQIMPDTAKRLGYNPKDMRDPAINAEAAAKLTANNIRGLKSLINRAPSDGEVYMAHFFGVKGAEKLINAYGSNKIAAKLYPANVVNSNRSIFFDKKTPRTVEQVYHVLADKININPQFSASN